MDASVPTPGAESDLWPTMLNTGIEVARDTEGYGWGEGQREVGLPKKHSGVMGERKTDRDREAERDTDRKTDRNRQTGRETDRDRRTETDGDRET